MKIILILLLAFPRLSAAVVEEGFTYAGVKFRVVRLEQKEVSVVWKDATGTPYRTFDRVQAAFAKQGKTVKFLMNAGIFEPGGIPSGLHIEDRKTLHPLNLADAPGNFFFKPNGVFYIVGTADRRVPSIVNAASFPQLETRIKAMSASWLECAIQSGPLLLIDGQRHPAFKENSASKLHRNGVGIDDKGRLVFAITEKGEMVNFWDFAGLFLKLGCKNALFLDGDISQMVANPGTPVSSNQFGVMFVVTE